MPSPSVNEQRFRILQALDLLDASSDAALDRLVRIAARAANAPIALVTFLGPDRQTNKARVGLDDPDTPLEDAFCVCALDENRTLVVPDARRDPRLAASRLVTGPVGVRAYAGHPIFFEGVALGTVCVMDRVARHFTDGDAAILADLAGLVSDLLARRDEQRRRRLEEQRAADCAVAAGEWLWETDAARRITWLAGRCDDDVGRLAGDRVGEPMADRAVLDGLGRPVVPRVTLARLMERQAPFRGVLAVLDEAAATPRFVERNGSPRFDEAHRFAGHRGSCREVTDRVRAERLALDTDAAQRASRSKSEFLSRVSHELRTPLNAVLGFTQMMLLDDTPGAAATPVQRQRLDIMLQAGHRLLALIDDLLDIGRIEQGRYDPVAEAVELHAAVDAAAASLDALCEQRGVRVRNAVPPGLLHAWADRRALAQVMRNLVSNGIQYNRAGGRVTVHADWRGSRVAITVEDDGPGLSPEQLAALYQPFNRLGAEVGPIPGSGLGLVICKALVERMDGTLEMSSRLGAGTTARVTLPTPPEGAVQRPHEAAAAVDASRRTVIYVEDNTLNAMLMEQLFEEEPAWRLLVASSGRAAIDLATTTPCDLMLVDMNLADMNGLQVLQALQSRGVQPRRGFIAVSADAFAEQVRVAKETGFAEYWTKPLDLRDVWQRLSELLG